MTQKSGHRLTIRIDLGSDVRVGPGKIALLEAIASAGPIAGAGRALEMSNKRAWDLVDELKGNVAEPVVSKAPGGLNGGGATRKRERHRTTRNATLTFLPPAASTSPDTDPPDWPTPPACRHPQSVPPPSR